MSSRHCGTLLFLTRKDIGCAAALLGAVGIDFECLLQSAMEGASFLTFALLGISEMPLSQSSSARCVSCCAPNPSASLFDAATASRANTSVKSCLIFP